MEWKHPSIIALKGFPFTGKTSISISVAKNLRFCLLLNLDRIVDSITPTAYSASRPPPAEAEAIIAEAFEVLCGQAEKQLSKGKSVVIDSLPLSRVHLDRLAALSKSSKIVVLDLRIDRNYAWEMRFEKKYDYKAGQWYKPRTWGEVRKVVRNYDKRLDEPCPGVSRLYLNVDVEVEGRNLIEAIQAVVFCPDDRHVDYLSIRNNNNYNPARKEVLSQRQISEMAINRTCGEGLHIICEFNSEGLVGYYADCLVCEEPVKGAAYACMSCEEAALHKSCAELQLSYTPQEYPAFIKKQDSTHAYCFPENFPCLRCRESGKQYSHECHGCILKSLLKSRLVPTIIEHDGHPHKLTLWASSIKNAGQYTCGACWEKGIYCGYVCGVCMIQYHVECALLPYPMKDHKHGGYSHPLELVFERPDKEFDDFPCSHCPENMRPEDWYYHCALCDQIYHLKCAFQDA